MPLMRCDENGWKWGSSGKCYTGPDAKKKAIKQGLAIEGPNKFAAKATEEEFEIAIGCREIPYMTLVALSRARFGKHED